MYTWKFHIASVLLHMCVCESMFVCIYNFASSLEWIIFYQSTTTKTAFHQTKVRSLCQGAVIYRPKRHRLWGPELTAFPQTTSTDGALALEGRIGPGLEGSRINRTGSGKVTFNILRTAPQQASQLLCFLLPRCYKQAEAEPARRAEHSTQGLGGSSQSCEEGEAAGSGPSHTPGLQLCYDVVARRENCLFSKEGVILS